MHPQFEPQKLPPAPVIEPWEAAAYAEMQADEAQDFAEKVLPEIGPATHRGTVLKVGDWLFGHHCKKIVSGAVANRRLGILALAIQAWSDWFGTTSHWHSPEDQRETDKIVAVIVRALRYISPEGVRRGMGHDD